MSAFGGKADIDPKRTLTGCPAIWTRFRITHFQCLAYYNALFGMGCCGPGATRSRRVLVAAWHVTTLLGDNSDMGPPANCGCPASAGVREPHFDGRRLARNLAFLGQKFVSINRTSRKALRRVVNAGMNRRATPPFHRSPRPALARPVALSDAQSRMVMTAASPLPPEKRSVLLQRIAGKLALCGAFADRDVEAAIRLALVGLIHEPAA